MSEVNPHHLLYENLILLNEFKPGGTEFAKCLKEDLFAKPNRSGLDQVLFYLCSMYDSVRYLPKIPWPVLDRNQERTFRQNTVTFVKEIIKENPEARLPPFSPSFLSTPGGERLAKFMWKFSLLVLKTVTERESDDVVLQYPTDCLDLVLVITSANIEETSEMSQNLCKLVIDSSNHAKELVSTIESQTIECKTLQKEISQQVHDLKSPFITEDDKLKLLSDDHNSVVSRWSQQLVAETEDAKAQFDSLYKRSLALMKCYKSVKSLVDSKTMPLVLDASDIPSSLKDKDNNLDLAYLFTETAKAARTVFNSLSMFGGFQSYSKVLPGIEKIRAELQQVETMMSEVESNYMELLTESHETIKIGKSVPTFDGTQSPPMGGLKLGLEMLQDVQTNTPPLIFDSQCDVSARLSSASPPLCSAVKCIKPASLIKLEPESFGTPKSSLLNLKSGFLSKNLSKKINTVRSLSAKNSQPSHSSPSPSTGARSNSVASIPETPANFCPKEFATSTAFKPTAFGNKSTSGKIAVEAIGTSGSSPHRIKQDMRNKFLMSQSSEVPKYIGTSATSIPSSIHKDNQEILPAVSKKSLAEESVVVSKSGSESNLIMCKNIDLKKKVFKAVDGEVIDIKEPEGSAKLESLVPSTSGSEKVNAASKTTRKLSSYPQILKEPLTSPQPKTPPRRLLEEAHVVVEDTNQVPSIIVVPAENEVFDSPQSLPIGPLSPPSADNSFFSTDVQLDFPGSCAPHFELGNNMDFEDDISPSGRVSLCPPIQIEETKAVATQDLPNVRRKSLQALIQRYKQLVSSSKPPEPIVVPPPTSPIPDISSDDLNFDWDLEKEHSPICD